MKIVSIIQARMGSSRFPGKVMALLNNKPMIGQLINQISFSSKLDDIILATTNDPIDDVLTEYVTSLGFKVFRGSENNVLSRYYNAAKSADADIIIRNTGDNPLVDPTIIDKLIQILITKKYDYVSNNLERSFPRGYDSEVLTLESIKSALKKAKQPEYLEHVTLYHKTHKEEYKIKNIRAQKNQIRPSLRLTIDTKRDFEVVSKVYEFLQKPNSFIPIDRVIEFLDSNPDIAKINYKVNQKKVFGEYY